MSLAVLAQQAVHEPAECAGVHWEEHCQQVRDVILPLHSALLRHIWSAGLPSSRQTRTYLSLMMRDWDTSQEGRLRELGLFTFQPQGELIRTHRHLKGG